MATEFYERKSGTKILRWQVIEEIDKDTLSGDIAEIKELEALADGTKQQLVNTASNLLGPNPDQTKTDIQNFDANQKKKREKFQDILDYWDYDRLPASGIDEIQASWIDLGKLVEGSGAVIESACGEDVGFEATRAIDGAVGSHWSHGVDERHSITVDLNYPKIIDGIRLWIPSTTTRFQLSDVVIRCAASIGGINSPANLVASGIAFAGDGNYAEYMFPGGNRRARFIRLENMQTDHASNFIRIREIELHAKVKFFTLEGD